MLKGVCELPQNVGWAEARKRRAHALNSSIRGLQAGWASLTLSPPYNSLSSAHGGRTGEIDRVRWTGSRASTSMTTRTIASQIVKAMNAQANEPVRFIPAPIT